METYLILAGCSAAAALIAFFITRMVMLRGIKSNAEELKKKEKEMLAEVEEKAEIIKKNKMLESKEKFLQMKAEHEAEVNKRNAGILANENRTKQKEQSINRKLEDLQRKEDDIDDYKARLQKQNEAIAIKK